MLINTFYWLKPISEQSSTLNIPQHCKVIEEATMLHRKNLINSLVAGGKKEKKSENEAGDKIFPSTTHPV